MTSIRFQRLAHVDELRPDATVLVDGEAWTVDEVMLGRELDQLACRPVGRTGGRRRIIRVEHGGLVVHLPDDDTAATLVQTLAAAVGGGADADPWSIPIADRWELRVDAGAAG